MNRAGSGANVGSHSPHSSSGTGGTGLGQGRTIVVGDVHGCREELDALLDRLAFASGDRLVFVGDVVARGPDSLGVLDIVRRTGAVLVRGNHEQKLLDIRAEQARIAGGSAEGTTAGPPSGKLHQELARELRPVDWSLFETSPLLYELPEHGLIVVHAGVLPGVPLEEQRPETLMRIRSVRSEHVQAIGRQKSGQRLAPEFGPEANGKKNLLWGAFWEGPPHVAFGHNAAPGLQLHPWATGLDTGCVYGGRLTAMVLGPGQKVLRNAEARRAALVSEPARRVWWQPTPRRVA